MKWLCRYVLFVFVRRDWENYEKYQIGAGCTTEKIHLSVGGNRVHLTLGSCPKGW